MNTRIYFNNNFIEFTNDQMQSSQDQSIKLDVSGGSEKKLNTLLEKFINGTLQEPVLTNLDFKTVFPILKKSFYYIEAAGGFIEQDNKYLFIRRHNLWDLPKGKLEKNEGIREAAVRECEEECGISQLTILKSLPSTFHIYPYKNGHALKQSYWFYMSTTHSGELVPQTEESITEVRWFTREEISAIVLKDTYYTISDVTRQALGA